MLQALPLRLGSHGLLGLGLFSVPVKSYSPFKIQARCHHVLLADGRFLSVLPLAPDVLLECGSIRILHISLKPGSRHEPGM